MRQIFFCKSFTILIQPLHTPTHPYAGTHTHPSSYTRTTCAHPHAESPTHLYTHSSFTRTTCAHPHTHSPAHPYTHSCHTYKHNPSNFTRTTCAHPYTYLQISIAHNCHNPYLQISVNIHIPLVTILTITTVTILTIKIQSNRVDNKRI